MSGADDAGMARASARASLTRLADRDPKVFAEFTINWLVRRLPLSALAELVTQLDAAMGWTDTGSGAGWPPGSGVVELPDERDR